MKLVRSKINSIFILGHFNVLVPVDPGDTTDPCGPDKPSVIMNSPIGEITSPDYPSDYPNDADCEWHITVDPGFVIRLTFLEFDVEDG